MTPICASLAAVLMLGPQSPPADSPAVEVTDIRRVFDNGEHNAFTDLTRFNDRYYLTFRSCPDGHMVHPTSSIIILVSDDLERWEQVHRFRVPKRDTRDPHFLVFQNRLFVYTGTWYSGDTTLPRDEYDLNKHLGYAAWTDDGREWHSPIMLEGTFGHYIWKAEALGNKAYLNGRRKRNFEMVARGEGRQVESVMLESDDGLVWKTRAMFQTTRGDETAFRFLADRSVLAVGRRGSSQAQLLRSAWPWTSWQRTDLDRYIGGPLLTRWGNRWVVGGRRQTPGGPRTSMCWLIQDKLTEFAELPSGGDNSYPGFIALSPTKAVMSWYSSHEKDEQGRVRTAIYMANLQLKPPGLPKEADKPCVALLVVGLSCPHCYQQVELFSRELDPQQAELVVVVAQGLPDPSQTRSLRARFVSDPDGAWADWFKLKNFQHHGHATLVLDTNQRCVWKHTGEDPFTDVKRVREAL